MTCTICHKPIVLVPSAEERARQDAAGRSADFYRRLFTTHSECELKKREEDTLRLMRQHREATKHINPSDVWALSQVGKFA